MIGARLVRQEDERFLRGEGRYVADLQLAGALEAVVVRSPHAHAKDRCNSHRGSCRVNRCCGCDYVERPATPNLPPIPCRIPSHGDVTPFLQPLMAKDVVRYVGEPVAMVVAATRALAEDAAELLEKTGNCSIPYRVPIMRLAPMQLRFTLPATSQPRGRLISGTWKKPLLQRP